MSDHRTADLTCRQQEIAALKQELTYAVDALEGKPWTGWTTDSARELLASLEPSSALETCPKCGGVNWRGAVDGPYGICMGCGYENKGDAPYA